MNAVFPILLAAALAVIQFLIGGTQFAYSFPAYAIIGGLAILSVAAIRKPGFKVSTVCLGSAVLFAGYVLWRAWHSPNPYLARSDAFLAVACLAVYLITALYMAESWYRLWVVGALLAVGVAHMVIATLQFKNGENWYLSYFGFYFLEKPSFRGSGLMISGNHMAGYLETVALFALSLACWSRLPAVLKMLAGYLVVLFYAAVIMSGSRGGYLSSIFSVLVFTVLSLWIVRMVNRRRSLLISLAAVAAVAVVLGGAAATMTRSAVIRDRLQRLANATDDVRRYNWQAALDQFQLSPVIGTGSGTHLYYGRLFRRPQLQSDPEHAHGDYVETLAEYGAIGGGLALVFLVVHLGAGLRAAREVATRRLCNSSAPPRSDTLALTLASLAAVAALMSHSVVDFNMHIPGNALLLAFVFGMLASPAIDKDSRAFSLPMVLRGALVPLGIALVAAVALKWPNERLANQARLALYANQFAESSELAQKAIEADPVNPEPYFYLGEAARVRGNKMPNFALAEPHYEEAIAAFRKGLEYFPQDENFWVRLGQTLDALMRFEEAGEAYREAIALDPTLGVLYGYYAVHFRATGEEEAAKACELAARSLGAGDFHDLGPGERLSLPSLFHENGEEGVENSPERKNSIEKAGGRD